MINRLCIFKRNWRIEKVRSNAAGNHVGNGHNFCVREDNKNVFVVEGSEGCQSKRGNGNEQW